MPKQLVRLALVAAAIAALVAATALAATPKRGAYLWTSKNHNNSVYFTVDGKPRKVESTSISAKSCNDGAPITISKSLKIKHGKFHFKGRGEFLTGATTKVTFRGKFVTKRKAKGRVHIGSCNKTLKFKAKYQANQQG